MDENQVYYEEGQKCRQTEKTRREKGSGKGLFIAGMLVGLASTMLTLAIFYAAVGIQVFAKEPENMYAGLLTQIQRLLTGTDKGTDTPLLDDDIVNTEMVEKLQLLEDTIDSRFYLDKVSDEDVRIALYRAMLEALNDPYSQYYTAEELEDLMSDTEGVFYGIGA